MAGGRRHHDEICCGVAAAGVSDGDGAVPEIDGCIVDPVLRWFQGRDRAVNLSCIRAVAQGIFAEPVGSRP